MYTRGMNNTANQEHLDKWKDDSWWPAIEKCDRLLKVVLPSYAITQIKDKFGGLRYYADFDSPGPHRREMELSSAEINLREIASAIISKAEKEVDTIEYWRKDKEKPERGFKDENGNIRWTEQDLADLSENKIVISLIYDVYRPKDFADLYMRHEGSWIDLNKVDLNQRLSDHMLWSPEGNYEIRYHPDWNKLWDF